VEQLDFLGAYGITAAGLAELWFDPHVRDGVVTPETQAWVLVPHIRALHEATGAGFEGQAMLRAWRANRPWAEVEAEGELTLPLPNAQRLSVELPRAEGVLRLTTNDFVQGPRFDAFELAASELHVSDTAPLRAAMKGRAPWIEPVVLGDAPLTAQDVTLAGTQQRISLAIGEARIGETFVRGELGFAGTRATGALEARVKSMGVGIRLDEGQASFQLLVKPGWLEAQSAELRRARARPPVR
jgi:hypothetical protein